MRRALRTEPSGSLAFLQRHRIFLAGLGPRPRQDGRPGTAAMVVLRAPSLELRQWFMPLFVRLGLRMAVTRQASAAHGRPAPAALAVLAPTMPLRHARPSLALRRHAPPMPPLPGIHTHHGEHHLTRIEPGRKEAPVASTTRWLRIEQRSVYPRIERTVVQSTARAASATAAHAAVDMPLAIDPSRPRPLATPTVPPSELSLPPRELSRVTDHVLQQLDQRVRSFRERQGLV